MPLPVAFCLSLGAAVVGRPEGAWTPLQRLAGQGAIGSPGGTHPIAASGMTAHVVWAQGGVINWRRSDDGGVTWGRAVRVTSHAMAEYPCSLELADGVLQLLWPDHRNGGWEMYHRRSTDGGASWGEETRLSPGVDLFRPGTAATGRTVHLAWGSRSSVEPTPAGTHTWGEIYYTRSTDAGATWEPIQRLTLPDRSAMRPGVAAQGRFVYLTWFDRRDAKDLLDWSIWTKRSTDGGATWGPDVRLSGRESHFAHHPEIVATPGGRVCCIWEGGQEFDGHRWFGDSALYARVSEDRGRSWGPAERITFVHAPTEWATHAKVAARGARVHLGWTEAPDGKDRPHAAYYMTSPDGGRTWQPPERLTEATDGECGVQSVGGTEDYAIVVVGKADELWYRRRAITAPE